MDNNTRVFTVDKFLGLNEAADGYTEIKMGEASRIENFDITEGLNLKTRPGVRRVAEIETGGTILATWSGKLEGRDMLILAVRPDDGFFRMDAYEMGSDGAFTLAHTMKTGAAGLDTVKTFQFDGAVHIATETDFFRYTVEAGFEGALDPYIPKVLIGVSPSGGGTTLENINLLSPYRRVEYNADGDSKAYWLPADALSVQRIVIDNVEYTYADSLEELGTFDSESHTFTFKAAPQKGVGNVEIEYLVKGADVQGNRKKILGCRLAESYNGATDTRLFFAGNGTNVCYYSGVTEAGAPDPTYFPAMNEVRVNMDSSEITGLTRHYTKLLVFTRDGAYTITYEPVTLTDGSTIAGFYLRSANRDFGNEVMGQIQTVDNYPRTITRGGIYEWKITSSFYRDERNANRISQRVDKTLKKGDVAKIITCDDNYRKIYFVFLNDEEGTVLVNRYGIGAEKLWTVYKGHIFRNVEGASMCGTTMCFRTNREVFAFDENALTDAPVTAGEEDTAIEAVWESGFHHFGADYRRKYSSILYLSMLSEENSELTVTAETDKRDDYLEKTVTWEQEDSPKIKRIRLKTKKFVYYKLKLRVGTKGKRATVLGYDQQVRFASMAK